MYDDFESFVLFSMGILLLFTLLHLLHSTPF